MQKDNKYSEGLIIYDLLLEGDYTDLIFESLDNRYFTIEPYKTVFEAGKRLWRDKKFSPATLMDVLAHMSIAGDTLGKTLEATYLVGSSQGLERTKATIDFIKDSYVKKVIQANISDLKPDEIADLVNKTYASEGELVNKTTVDRMIKQFIARDLEVIPYPFEMLNNLLGGIRKKEYTIVAARPSVGKTAFLEQMFWDATALGKRCLFISLEMGQEALFKRQILRTTGKDLFKNIVAPEDKAVLYENIKHILGESQIAVGVFSPSDIDKMVKEFKPDIVLVDYLQQIMLRNARMSEFEKVTNITKELAFLKTKYNVAVVVASQYSRNATHKQPRLSDLRSSGQIEQDADVVLSLWKDDSEEPVLSGAMKVYVDCLKNRNGLVFCNIPDKKEFKHQFSLMFLKERVKFFDAKDPDDIKMEGDKKAEDLDDVELYDLFNG